MVSVLSGGNSGAAVMCTQGSHTQGTAEGDLRAFMGI